MAKLKLPEIKISVKIKKTGEEFKVSTSRDVHEVCKSIFNPDTLQLNEEFHLICLNKSNIVLGTYKISQGGYSATFVDMKMIMLLATQTLATSIIVAHNHPSGKLEFSNEDIVMTRKLKDACKIMDMRLLEHLLYTDNGYKSMADEGLLY